MHDTSHRPVHRLCFAQLAATRGVKPLLELGLDGCWAVMVLLGKSGRNIIAELDSAGPCGHTPGQMASQVRVVSQTPQVALSVPWSSSRSMGSRRPCRLLTSSQKLGLFGLEGLTTFFVFLHPNHHAKPISAERPAISANTETPGVCTNAAIFSSRMLAAIITNTISRPSRVCIDVPGVSSPLIATSGRLRNPRRREVWAHHHRTLMT